MSTDALELAPEAVGDADLEDVAPTGDADPAGHRRYVSIRLIVTAATVALVAAAVLGVGSVGERNARVMLTRETEARILMTARHLALLSSGALLSDVPELTLHPAVREIQEGHPELAFVVIVDHENTIQGHADARSLGQRFAPPADLRPVQTQQSLTTGEAILGSERTLVARVPVRTTNGSAIGQVFVGLHRSHLEAAVVESRRQQAIVVLVLLGLAVAGALLLMTLLLRPIDKLRDGLERIGHGDLDTPIQLRDRTEFQLLAEAINHMAGELRAAQVQEMEKERLKHEMELARQIQGSLLPAASLVTGDFEILGVHQAAAEVGGDFFDVLELPEGNIGIAIADVSGKGLAGCLVMSMVAVLLRSLRRAYATPSELLIALDEQLSGNLRPGVFVTMFYGILDPQSGRLRYASAGHTPLLVVRAATGDAEWHYTEGIPIGAVRGGELRETLRNREIQLQPGDSMVQFTDGVNEAWEPRDRQQFGFQQVERVVLENAGRGSRAVIEGLRRALAAWTGDLPRLDDETVVVVHRVARVEIAPHTVVPSELTHDLVERVWRMRRSGQRLSIRDPAELSQLCPWLRRCPHLRDLPEDEAVLLEHALHEQCANIIEHGYEPDESSTIDLWWIPEGDIWCELDARDPQLLDDNPSLLERIRRGVFLVRDHGMPYSPSQTSDSDLDDPAVRKRGRGLGLRIIQEVMNPLLYQRGAAYGNLTIMRFDPMQRTNKEAGHASFPG
jgi:serine phosphatase RsbU (regulator of sigma subunit)/anti-sigma regulatory factor (Ser/Thr protein kinase)